MLNTLNSLLYYNELLLSPTVSRLEHMATESLCLTTHSHLYLLPEESLKCRIIQFDGFTVCSMDSLHRQNYLTVWPLLASWDAYLDVCMGIEFGHSYLLESLHRQTCLNCSLVASWGQCLLRYVGIGFGHTCFRLDIQQLHT